MNKGIYIALFSIGLAQALKIPIHFVKTGKWKAGFIFPNGRNAQFPFCRGIFINDFYCLKKGNPDD